MIIFNLDGTLSNCEHRRHFVDPTKLINPKYNNSDWIKSYEPDTKELLGYVNVREPIKWKPDWKAFYEACDKDEPIMETLSILENIGKGEEYGTDTPWVRYENIQIWSGRCESVRKKTEKWLSKNLYNYHEDCPKLKMRPIGDNTPDYLLKEKWLDEAIQEGKIIEMVFDDRPKVIRMWRRRGIFVFDCNQTGEEF